MKKLKLKKVTLAEMPREAISQVNGGKDTGINQESATTTVILISIYTVSIVASACDDCASHGCQSRGCQGESKASYCLCSGYDTCNM